MAGKKYLINNAGQIAEEFSIQSSAGAADATKIPALDSTGRLDVTFMPVGVGPEVKSIIASENLAAGDFVNVYNNAGVINVRKADASGGNAKKAHGYVLAAVLSGATALVYYGNLNTALTGLTLGGTYYLSGSTPGAITTTAPSTAAFIVQQIGVADSTTELIVEIQPTITLS